MNKQAINLVIIGAGSWGTTLGILGVRAGATTTLVVRNAEALKSLRDERRHPTSLPGITIPAELRVTDDSVAALRAAEVVVIAVPTQVMRAAVVPIPSLLKGKTVIAAAKGIEVGTSLLPTDILRELLGDRVDTPIGVLSGPNLAMEIALGKPSASVIAFSDPTAAETGRRALMNEAFRVYTSEDVIGVQIGGALKNIIAIGAGIGDGLKAGDNAKAAFLTRGITEIARLGVHLGADPLTFAGLSGIGDLICTCSSSLSRNHRVGIGIAQGKSLDEILRDMTEVAEGVMTTRAVVELARKHGVDMPIAQEMYRVLFEEKSPQAAVHDLMIRDARSEQR